MGLLQAVSTLKWNFLCTRYFYKQATLTLHFTDEEPEAGSGGVEVCIPGLNKADHSGTRAINYLDVLPERIPDIPLAWVALLKPYKDSLIRLCLRVPRTSRAISLRKSWSPERGSGHEMAPKEQAPMQSTAGPLGILHILCPCVFSLKRTVLVY